MTAYGAYNEAMNAVSAAVHDLVDAERSVADDLAAFITKYPVPPPSERLRPEWIADRDAVLARHREARQR